MPNLKIRIGASIDANFPALFRPMVDAAKDARAQIKAELNGLGDDVAKAAGRASAPRRTRAGAGAGAGAGSTGSTAGAGGYRDPAGPAAGPDPARRRKRQKQIETDQERHDREMADKRRKAAKEEAAYGRQMEREAERMRSRISSGTVSNLGSFAGSVARRGIGVAADLARGAGLDFSLGGALQSRMDLQKRATDLSNSGYMADAKGENGKRQDPKALMATVQEAADAAALDTGKTMEGLQAFVGKTGDLETGRAALKDLAMLARATGADMNDVVSAAGDVAANIGDVGKEFDSAEEKAAAINAIMRSIAGQGKVGAVEMKDLASQMAKLASSAPQFSGSVEKNITAMGVLAQEARSHGGAATATQATTSVQGFVNTFSKKARRAAFKAAGVDIEDSTGKLLDPEEIIVNSLVKTGGKKGAMNKLFMDAGAQRVTRGFQSVYTDASSKAEAAAKKSGKSAKEIKFEGEEAGAGAVRDEFAKLRKAEMKKDEVKGSFDASMQTSEAQAQILRNKLQKELGDAAAGAAEKLAPQLLKLIPSISGVVEQLGQLANWAASNPLQAATAALGASLMKSVGEEVLRNATSKMFGIGPVGSGGGGGAAGGSAGGSANDGFLRGLSGGGAVSTAMNIAGAAIAITATAMAVYSVGTLTIDKVADFQKKGQDNLIGDEARAINARGELRAAKAQYDQEVEAGAPSTETAARLDRAKAGVEEQSQVLRDRITTGEEQKAGGSSGFLAAGANSLFGTRFFGTGENLTDQRDAKASATDLEGLKAELQAMKDAQKEMTSALKGGINILNMPDGGGPFVNPAGRVGPE